MVEVQIDGQACCRQDPTEIEREEPNDGQKVFIYPGEGHFSDIRELRADILSGTGKRGATESSGPEDVRIRENERGKGGDRYRQGHSYVFGKMKYGAIPYRGGESGEGTGRGER